MKEIRHIDCFSGVGGICTGFKAVGIKTVLAIEKVKSNIDTYKSNHPEVSVIHNDIRNVAERDLASYVNSIDIVTAGMPCETFSTAGSKSRSFYDNRQILYIEAIRIARIVNSPLILFENVPGITTKKINKKGEGLIIDAIFDELSRNSYKFNVHTILNASDFGIPQFRKRFFILASNSEKLKLKVPISFHNGIVTVKDALSDLPLVLANSECKNLSYNSIGSSYVKKLKNSSFWKIKNNNTLTYHIAPKHRKGTIERFKLIKQGEGLKDLFYKFDSIKIAELQEKKILPKKYYIQRNRRLDPNKPSHTITSHCLDEAVHPILNRALTVREVARLQSFPDAYDFIGGPFICPHIYETQDKYEQIGDAVPPLLAYEWGKIIKEIILNAHGL